MLGGGDSVKGNMVKRLLPAVAITSSMMLVLAKSFVVSQNCAYHPCSDPLRIIQLDIYAPRMSAIMYYVCDAAFYLFFILLIIVFRPRSS